MKIKSIIFAIFLIAVSSSIIWFYKGRREEVERMANHDCIFCKIISGLIPCKKIHETADLIVIQDIAPKAPIHYLIIPKQHVPNIQSCTEQDQKMLGTLLFTAKQLSASLPGNPEFKLVSNNGASVGQSVFHIHIHFLAGNSKFAEQMAV